jgi:hypothetical protein
MIIAGKLGLIMRKLMVRRRRAIFYVCVLLALGIFGAGLISETATTSSASPTCAGQELAGRWLNLAKPDGSDVISARLDIPCTGPAAALGLAGKGLQPKIQLQLSVRCMHVLTCDWQQVDAAWTASTDRSANHVLAAHYDQDRFDRSVELEPTGDGKLKLTLTSRLKGLAVAPVKSIYTLEREKV